MIFAAAALLFAGVATPPPRATFDVGITHVSEYGKPQARPLIFVPCLSCGPWIWDRQVAALAPSYDVFTLALPGFDGRPMVAGDDLMRRAVESIHELIASRHLTNAVVIGHSLGGTIAVMFAETYPNDAAGIVTVEGGYPEAPTQKQRDAAVARSVAPYGKSSQAQLASTLHDNMLQYTITRKPDVATMTTLAGRSDPTAIVAWMRAALLLDLTPDLYKISVPFTAIVPFDPVIDPYAGFKTSAAKLRAYEVWVAHAKRGKVILIEPSRHFVMIDQPQQFETALESALAR